MKRIVLGITGGIASGKSTVMKLLSRQGVATISSDELAHACIKRGKSAYRQTLAAFGNGILGQDREINRKRLAEIVFLDSKKRRRLERIIHPCVIAELKRFASRHHGVVAMDIPLLFEAGLTSMVDKTVVVYCRSDQQIARMIRRNGFKRAEAFARLRAQWPLSRKRAKADAVILNTGNKKNLSPQVRSLLQGLI